MDVFLFRSGYSAVVARRLDLEAAAYTELSSPGEIELKVCVCVCVCVCV